jgi:hypothetical protein
MWTTRPLLKFYGGHPHAPRHGGFAPLDPRLPTLVGQRSAGVLGPTRGGIADVDYSPPFKVLWGDTPTAPRHGGFAPLDPRLPAFVGLRFASVLGVNLSLGPSPRRRGENPAKFSPFPRREGGQGVRSERHTPTIPRHGGFASWPPRLPAFVGLGFADVLGSTRGGVVNVGKSPLILVSWGGHSPQWGCSLALA